MLTERDKRKMKKENELRLKKEKKLQEKEKKKQKICRAAVKLFLEKGFEDTTILNITRRAGVAYGTFYSFFERKEDVIHCFLDLEVEKTLNEVRRKMASVDDFFDQLRIYDSVFLDHLFRNKELIAIVAKERILNWGWENVNQEKYTELFSDIVKKAKNHNKIDNGIDIDRAIKIFSSLKYTYMINWLKGEYKSKDDCIEEFQKDMKFIFFR